MSLADARTFDPVFDAQRVFRCLLQATAQPGKLFVLPPLDLTPPETVALAFLDHEVTFCVLGSAGDEARKTDVRVSRATGSRAVPPPEADFALVFGGDARGGLRRLRRGTLERPEVGATAVYAVGRLDTTGPLTLQLSGPGVPGTRSLGIFGLAPGEGEAMIETRSDYPRGVDVYLVDDAGQVAGLPRSTRLEVV